MNHPTKNPEPMKTAEQWQEEWLRRIDEFLESGEIGTSHTVVLKFYSDIQSDARRAEKVKVKELVEALKLMRIALEGSCMRHRMTLAELCGDQCPTFTKPCPSTLENIKNIGAAISAHDSILPKHQT